MNLLVKSEFDFGRIDFGREMSFLLQHFYDSHY